LIKPFAKRHWFWTFGKILLAIGILICIFRFVPFKEVIKATRGADIGYVLVAFALPLFTVLVSACRLKILTDIFGLSLSTGKITQINFITRFYGLMLPGYLASGAIRWHRLYLLEKKGSEVLTSIVFSRFNFMLVSFFFGLFFLLLDRPSPFWKPLSITLLSFFLVGISIQLMGRSNKWSILIRWLNEGCQGFLPSIVRKMFAKILEATVQCSHLPRHHHFSIIFYSVLENMIGIVSTFLLAVSLNINISLIVMSWVQTIILIVNTIPISISGLGIREGGLIFLLKPYGVSGPEAVALSFLVFARNVIISLIGGVIEVRQLLSGTLSKRS
jgi:uncharacterized protein (TIRG00374 family)